MTSHALRRAGALLLLSLCAHMLSAQTLPKPREFYFDADAATARAIALYPGDDPDTVQRLMRLRDRGGRDADKATAQLARIAFDSGRADTGRALYEAALAEAGNNSALRNPLLWNYGWDLYRSGDAEGALARWREAGAERFNNPSWAPPTLALALWKLDRKDEAVQWYAAAVRTEPQRWRSAANFPVLLPDWREAERAMLAEVQAAWAQNPPSWP